MKRLIPILFLLSCGTKYKQYDPNTGLLTHNFSTYADFGVLPDSKDVSGSSTGGGIPILGGSFDNAQLMKMVAAHPQFHPRIQVGDLVIEGTVVHSSSINAAGHWAYRTVRAVATALVVAHGLSAWESVKQAQEMTSQAAIQGGVDTAGIEAIRDVDLAEIAGEVEKTAILHGP